ncbi:MAG TPA: substrate-binding domain-containing protein [Candidatus Angelobacter sp.]|nr:substrate-binding domain-containing protein [Candidatus Angelobacter sp.]
MPGRAYNVANKFVDLMPMEQLQFLLSLTTDDNDYQREQLAAAEKTAREQRVSVKTIHANNDVVEQSQQLLEIIQSSKGWRPHAIILEPVSGTGLPRVAEAAIAAGIGWVVLNCDVDYIAELRSKTKAPVFAITSDHLEIGRIQGRQFAALLPRGGSVLYIQGPSGNLAAKQRTMGMEETKPANVQIRAIRGQWTEASASQAVASWLRLATARDSGLDLVAAQDDEMAMGARKTLEKETSEAEQPKWSNVAFTGVDGLPMQGQVWVKKGLLAATIIVPANTGAALEMLVRFFQSGAQVPERTLTVSVSFPPIEQLKPIG